MSTTTTNLGLIKPELTDVADITAMNENWDKVDDEIEKRTPFYVTLGGNADDGYTVDKTFAEIITACNEGRRVVLIENAYGAIVEYRLQYVYSNEIDFSYHKGINHTVIEVYAHGVVTRKNYQYFSGMNPPSYDDVGAEPLGAVHNHNTAEDAHDGILAPIDHTHTPTEIGAVPITRTVNSKALSANISLSASDVGAEPLGAVNEHNTAGNAHDGILLPITGGTLSGSLGVRGGVIELNAYGFSKFANSDHSGNGLLLQPLPDNDLSDILLLKQLIDNALNTTWRIYGSHNKPRGTYTGNGNSNERIINIGGYGHVLNIIGNNGFGFITTTGGFTIASNGTVTRLSSTHAYYSNSTKSLELKTTNENLNATGVTYTWTLL